MGFIRRKTILVRDFYRWGFISKLRCAFRAAQIAILCVYFSLTPFSIACASQQRPRRAEPQANPQSKTNNQSEDWASNINDIVRLPSPEVDFIVGPQLKAGSRLNPVPWYDQIASQKGAEHGNAFPEAAPFHALSGTVTVTKGSTTIEGNNTRFLSDLAGVAPYTHHILIEDGSGVQRDYIITAVPDNNHITTSVGWQEASASGLRAGKASGDEYDAYVNQNYYDQALCQYINYYRTGDSRFLAYARKIADSWWSAPFIARGQADVETSLAPRNISLNGLILRALDGRPEMWPWITKYVRQQFQIWVGMRVKYPGFYYGVRDPGYMMLFASNLARVHPDQAVRAEFRAQVLDAAVNYYARLQSPDGGFYFDLDNITHTTQPFQVGLLAEGLIAVHRLTGDERVKKTILSSAEHQYEHCYNPRGWRGMYYFVGGNSSDGKQSCASGCGAASNPFPPSDPGSVAEVRQLNGTTIHQFGYAYLISGDQKFKTWGDEILDATFGGRDRYRGLAAARAKEYDECYRSSGKYLAWRLSHGDTSSNTKGAVRDEQMTPAVAVNPVSNGALESVGAALDQALRISTATASTPSESQVKELLQQTQTAQQVITAQRDKLLTPSEALFEINSALEHIQLALQIVASQGNPEDAKLRIGWAAARLKRAMDRMKSR